jgi:GT2 family glycosyltransferase
VFAEKLSVVLLTYNCAHRIRPILERAVDVGAPVIVVDNGSHDDIAAVVAQFPTVTFVPLAENIGAAARNVGVLQTTTPYVAFCDDDGWYEPDGLRMAADLLDRYENLAVVNARILVGQRDYLDPISSEMADSPIPDRVGIPGIPILGFMGGASVMRSSAFLSVGGYDERFFMGGEEETVALPLAKAGWHLRYVPEIVMHHLPSLANATRFRALGMRNTMVNGWLHRRLWNAVKWTAFTLVDTPKNADYVRGVRLALACIPWILRERRPMDKQLNADLSLLDARHYAERRSFFEHRAWHPDDVSEPV